jgi:hypothetical protein
MFTLKYYQELQDELIKNKLAKLKLIVYFCHEKIHF